MVSRVDRSWAVQARPAVHRRRIEFGRGGRRLLRGRAGRRAGGFAELDRGGGRLGRWRRGWLRPRRRRRRLLRLRLGRRWRGCRNLRRVWRLRRRRLRLRTRLWPLLGGRADDPAQGSDGANALLEAVAAASAERDAAADDGRRRARPRARQRGGIDGAEVGRGGVLLGLAAG